MWFMSTYEYIVTYLYLYLYTYVSLYTFYVYILDICIHIWVCVDVKGIYIYTCLSSILLHIVYLCNIYSSYLYMLISICIYLEYIYIKCIYLYLDGHIYIYIHTHHICIWSMQTTLNITKEYHI